MKRYGSKLRMVEVFRWNMRILIVLEMLRHVAASENKTVPVFLSVESGTQFSDVSQKGTSVTAPAEVATTTTTTTTTATAPSNVPLLLQRISTTVATVTRHLLLTSTSSKGLVRHSFARGMPPLHVPYLPHNPHSRWGPFFEEGQETVNVTARVGSTVILDCRIGLLQDKTVTWLHHKKDSMHLLTVGRAAYSRDERINLSFRYPNNYRLEIVFVNRRDEGLYECQVATHPPKVKRLFLIVTAPEISIVDESKREVTERYYKAGSALELTCIATQAGGPGESQPIFWKHRDQILTDGISTNSTNGTQIDETIYSSLTIEPLEPHHAGNYSCSIGTVTSASVIVHVLNGELPAAVHHGNNSSVMQFGSRWLLLFTVCAVYFR